MLRRYELRVLGLISNYLEVVKKIKEIVRRLDPHARVYVFGSVVKGEYTGASDIDVLVIISKKDLKYKIMVEAYKCTEAPIELHVVTEEEFRNWYRRFLKENELIEV